MYINYIYKCKNGLIKLYLSVDFLYIITKVKL